MFVTRTYKRFSGTNLINIPEVPGLHPLLPGYCVSRLPMLAGFWWMTELVSCLGYLCGLPCFLRGACLDHFALVFMGYMHDNFALFFMGCMP